MGISRLPWSAAVTSPVYPGMDPWIFGCGNYVTAFQQQQVQNPNFENGGAGWSGGINWTINGTGATSVILGVALTATLTGTIPAGTPVLINFDLTDTLAAVVVVTLTGPALFTQIVLNVNATGSYQTQVVLLGDATGVSISAVGALSTKVTGLSILV